VRDSHLARDLSVASSGAEFPVFVEQKHSSIFNTAGKTPHWKAWNWLSSHQNLTNLVKWRKKQLFAMAAFFFAFGGEH